MTTRRDFMIQSGLASAAVWGGDLLGRTTQTSIKKNISDIQLPMRFGLGGVALGNGWHENTNEQITATLKAAWDSGVRYFDTSPFYGFGLSERRLGHFLFEKKRSDFILSTKVGRIFEADPGAKPQSGLWKGQLNFKYHYDYSAAGVRKSVEDSLNRLGLSSIDTVFVHDLSPDNGQLGNKWTEQFDIATKGAFPELSKMREEGTIKAWGLGVNRPEPILKALQVSDPDVMLVAIQYSLMEHRDALHDLFPAMEKKGVKAVIGGPLNGGFLADRDRWNYGSGVPQDLLEKRKRIKEIIEAYHVSLSTVALQFAVGHPVVAAVIPGASLPEQVQQNVASMSAKIPADLWRELKDNKLIDEQVPLGV